MIATGDNVFGLSAEFTDVPVSELGGAGLLPDLPQLPPEQQLYSLTYTAAGGVPTLVDVARWSLTETATSPRPACCSSER